MWDIGLTSIGKRMRATWVVRDGRALLGFALTNAVGFAAAALGLHRIAAAPRTRGPG
jgi:hypothetical protein